MSELYPFDQALDDGYGPQVESKRLEAWAKITSTEDRLENHLSEEEATADE